MSLDWVQQQESRCYSPMSSILHNWAADIIGQRIRHTHQPACTSQTWRKKNRFSNHQQQGMLILGHSPSVNGEVLRDRPSHWRGLEGYRYWGWGANLYSIVIGKRKGTEWILILRGSKELGYCLVFMALEIMIERLFRWSWTDLQVCILWNSNELQEVCLTVSLWAGGVWSIGFYNIFGRGFYEGKFSLESYRTESLVLFETEAGVFYCREGFLQIRGLFLGSHKKD